jgi:hypothetical protein
VWWLLIRSTNPKQLPLKDEKENKKFLNKAENEKLLNKANPEETRTRTETEKAFQQME